MGDYERFVTKKSVPMNPNRQKFLKTYGFKIQPVGSFKEIDYYDAEYEKTAWIKGNQVKLAVFASNIDWKKSFMKDATRNKIPIKRTRQRDY